MLLFMVDAILRVKNILNATTLAIDTKQMYKLALMYLLVCISGLLQVVSQYANTKWAVTVFSVLVIISQSAAQLIIVVILDGLVD